MGDVVQVVRVPGGNDGGGNSTLLVGAAAVTSSAGAITDSKTSANSSLNVTLLVPQSKVNLVAAAAAAKTLSVAKLAPGTPTDVASGGSN